tara:strand:- start:2752 stop:3048 length:297 start_codon:yes stop_codon:yes gene_type:complete
MKEIKTAKVSINYTGWDYDDTYTVKSLSTGRTLRVKPNGHWSHGNADEDRRLTEEEENVLRRIRQDVDGKERRWEKDYEVEMTHDDMRLFQSASQKAS